MDTFQHQPLSLVLLEHLRSFSFYRLITVSLRARDFHDFAVQLEAIHLLDCVQSTLLAVENDKGLAFSLQR